MRIYHILSLSNKNSKLNAAEKCFLYENQWSREMDFLGNLTFDALFNTSNSLKQWKCFLFLSKETGELIL